MICEMCKEREATIEFTAVVGDQKKTLHLCAACSKREGTSPTAPPGEQKVTPAHASGSKKVNVVIGQLAGGGDARKSPCPGCGMTYEEFRKVGRLGCARCYEAFGAPLRRLLKRIHGSETHIGRGPRSAAGRTPSPPAPAAGSADDDGSLEELRQALAAAVDAEQYERAAELRDRIARLRERSTQG